MAGRGRGLGRGRGVIKLQEEPPLSEEEKLRLLKGDLPKAKNGQFEDAKNETVRADSHDTTPTNGKHSGSEVSTCTTNTPVGQTPPPQTATLSPATLSPKSKDVQPKHTNGYPDTTGAAGRSQSSPAQLNPKSSEFVPKSRLNIMASEFIPTSYYPPTGASAEQSTVDNDDMLTILDILEGFDRQSSIEDPVLVEAADMLITTTIYPGMYDDCLLEFSETIKTVTVSDTVLQDIGEMLIQWGVSNTGLRYTAVRICDFMCKANLQGRFRGHFFTALQKLFQQEQEKSDRTDEEIIKLIEFSLFMAEMFYRIRLADDKVVWVLGLAVVELMFILVDLKQDDTIKCACNVLKLTGYVLENNTPVTNQFDPLKKVDTLIMALKVLCNDKNLGKRVCEVIINVLQFRGKNYDRHSAAALTPKIKETLPIELEVPVKDNDWSEFIDDSGNVIEGYDEHDYEHYYYDTDDLDPNIDEEIMRGYEEFLQEFEDHLLLQEFGNRSKN